MLWTCIAEPTKVTSQENKAPLINAIGGENGGHDDEVKRATFATDAGVVKGTSSEKIFRPMWFKSG